MLEGFLTTVGFTASLQTKLSLKQIKFCLGG